MSAKTGKKAAGVTAQIVRREGAAGAVVQTAAAATRLTPASGTRRYKPRARKCANKACQQVFTPSAKHGKFCSEKCRKQAYRKRKAKTLKPKAAEPILVLATCEYCGVGFFAEAGHPAKFCSPSHRTAAWRQRREATAAALAEDLGIDAQTAADTLERMGMARTGRYLRQKGYVYDEQARRWLLPVSSEAFVHV